MWCRTVGGIVTLMLSLLTAPLISQAQQAAHVPRLGLLMPGSASGYAPRIEAFRHGLRDLGYVEGHNITLEYRFADGQADRLPALVAELVRLPVDVLVVDGTVAVRPAQHATTTIPIVMVAGDPVGAGLVASLAHPGGNITGVSMMIPDLSGKRLEILKEAIRNSLVWLFCGIETLPWVPTSQRPRPQPRHSGCGCNLSRWGVPTSSPRPLPRWPASMRTRSS